MGLRDNSIPEPAPRATAGCYSLAGWGAVEVTSENVQALRLKPGTLGGESISISLLKYADEQAIAGFAAVLRAIHEHPQLGTNFRDWGILATPHFLGRASIANVLAKFPKDGYLSMTPHLIPHRCLHSLAGTISHGLKVHGPNLGIGGGPGARVQSLLAAAAWLEGGELPGVWVVMIGWETEHIPVPGNPTAPWKCLGLALALTPGQAGWPGARVHIEPTASLALARDLSVDTIEDLDLFHLKATLESWAVAPLIPTRRLLTVASGVSIVFEKGILSLPQRLTA